MVTRATENSKCQRDSSIEPVMFHDWAKKLEFVDDVEEDQESLSTTKQLMEPLKFLYFGLIS